MNPLEAAVTVLEILWDGCLTDPRGCRFVLNLLEGEGDHFDVYRAAAAKLNITADSVRALMQEGH